MNFSPLSELLRPKDFAQVVGQEHLLNRDSLIYKLLEIKKPISLLLWGPPGCGKTSIAKLYCKSFELPFFELSPILHGISDIKKIIEEQKNHPLLNKKIIIFIDEIHRFNKSQQDVFLPHIEKGDLILVGATTENPSFSLNPALVSRLRILSLSPLSSEDLEKIIHRFSKESDIHIEPKAQKALIELSSGDARHLINLLENVKACDIKVLHLDNLFNLTQKKLPAHDKNADHHHNLISALHKSIRGSDPQSSLYYLCRMLQAGEDPNFIARRLVRIASEDIGLADPDALQLCLNSWNAYKALGSPEGELALAQAVIYLALAPKSNRTYQAYTQAKDVASKTSHLAPPKHILNSPTKLMKELGYGKGYIYDHETKEGFSGQNYFPDSMTKESFYHPKEIGFEREMSKRLKYFEKLREQLNNNTD